MERRDYILREIEKITILIQYLLGKYKPSRSKEEYQTTEKLIREKFKEKHEKEFEYFFNIEPKDFEKELVKSNGFSFENIELLADLFLTLGNDQFSDSQKYLNKALELYEYIDNSSKTFSFERTNKINSIKLI